MTTICIQFCVVLSIAVGCCCVEFHQEKAKVTVANPKYIVNVSAITRRASRHAPYLTTMQGTTLVPIGNNFSFALVLQLKTGGDFKVTAKVCDTIQAKWMQVFMAKYSNLPLDRCPFPPGKYIYKDMELPPREMPIPIIDGDYYISAQLFLPGTKEIIVEVKTLLHFDQNSRSRQKKNNNNKG